MRVTIRSADEDGTVWFDSPYGSAVARWAGSGPPPENGEVDVEIEIGEVAEVVPTAAGAPRISTGQLIGLVETTLGDELYALRLGNSVLTVEMKSDPLPGQWIAVRAEGFSLYPYAL
ncbi:hypothetical protein [Amycolatopsis magusensis]|uniref:hypothetical protein n=1 Tax=Amycolatopsis magusensis TaxID=882444 RepID=UPI0037A4CC2E